MKNVRVRCYSLISYLDVSLIRSILLDKQKQIKRWAFIIHDKDDKEPHVHILIRLVNNRLSSDILSWFDGDSNTLIQAVASEYKILRYLCHLDDKEKYQYSIDCVEKFNYTLNDFQSCDGLDDLKEFDIVNDLLNLESSMLDLLKKYGRDFLINLNKFVTFARFVAIDIYGQSSDYLVEFDCRYNIK